MRSLSSLLPSVNPFSIIITSLSELTQLLKYSPYYGYVEFTHPQGNFEIQLPDAGHEATVQDKPVDNYTKIRVVRGEGTLYKRSAVCARPNYKNGNTLIGKVHLASEKIL